VIFIHEVRIGQTAPLEQKNLAPSFFRAVYLYFFLGAFSIFRIDAYRRASSRGMKVLIDHSSPFLLAHGGAQVQIEQTKHALEGTGVEVEFLRWWDSGQHGDIIHFFGRPASEYVDLAHKKNIRVVVGTLLGGLGVRPRWKRLLQKMVIRTAQKTMPSFGLARMGWKAWTTADAYIAVTRWESELMKQVFGARANRVHVVPNAVSNPFFEQLAETRGPWLVTTASILRVKRVIETAQAAVIAQTPYWIIGRPFSESDDYYQKFVQLCRRHSEILRYDNIMRPQNELAKIYRQARGFVLLSRWESQSLSALEAAACECPLLLSDLPWARSTFGGHASYCPIRSAESTAKHLRSFYDRTPVLPPPPKPPRWNEVGKMLRGVYEQVLNNSTSLRPAS
jgi:glycosyltransferase involved in cell wall biosynthesis